MKSDFLERMAAASAERARTARAARPESGLTRELGSVAALPRLELSGPGFDLIAEVKRRAPSVGRLESSFDPGTVVRQARRYRDAGVAAVSVLTEPTEFDGTLSDLTAVCREVDIPVMRKDFLVDPYQIVEAACAGASGVLLILKILDDDRLAAMLDAARELQLFVLLEAFDADDLDRATPFVENRGDAPLFLGLNARDLRTLKIDGSRFQALAGRFPDGPARVAESGLSSAEDAERVARLGYRAALVGSALMREEDPTALAEAMIRSGRVGAQLCR